MNKVMSNKYREKSGGVGAPWKQLKNLDELIWDGDYDIFARDVKGTINMPYTSGENENFTLKVIDYPDKSKLHQNRKIVQKISRVEPNGGVEDVYTRTCCKINGELKWSEWKPEMNSGNGSSKEYNITWNEFSHIDTFTTAGIYNITGERINSGDGLPFANFNPGHTIHARLVVLDSSVNADEVCVTQILMLSNRIAGDGNVHLRTGNAASKGELKNGEGWEQWGKLQQNIEVGQTTSLDEYIDNGIYSGVYMVSPTQLETFVLVVINNYALAASMGEVRNISQFKYSLNIDGTFSYKTRTGRGDAVLEWGGWVDLGAASTTDIQDGAITAQKLSADVRTKVENPLRPLYIAAGAEYNDSSEVIKRTAFWGEVVDHLPGHYYLNGLGDIDEEEMMKIYQHKDDMTVFLSAKNQSRFFQDNAFVGYRTLFGFNGGTRFIDGLTISGANHFASTNDLEVIKWMSNNKWSIYASSIAMTAKEMFFNIKKVRVIDAYTPSASESFNNAYALEYIGLYKLKHNVNFSYSQNISKESVLYMIQNAAPTSAITITLHPDAYARLADDAEIVAALEAQPLISLVSA